MDTLPPSHSDSCPAGLQCSPGDDNERFDVEHRVRQVIRKVPVLVLELPSPPRVTALPAVDTDARLVAGHIAESVRRDGRAVLHPPQKPDEPLASEYPLIDRLKNDKPSTTIMTGCPIKQE